MNIPEKLKYTKDHEWIKVDSSFAYVGITDFAQSELGDVVFIEMPNVGDTFEKNDVFGTIEAVKTLADLFLPVSGKIVEVNEKLDSQPELVNSDPYADGWIVKLEISNTSDLETLLNNNDYKELIK
tara:strand:- start:27 stop:404 length:378 start_codon:yes stop_codon:yes gene_type:complete